MTHNFPMYLLTKGRRYALDSCNHATEEGLEGMLAACDWGAGGPAVVVYDPFPNGRPRFAVGMYRRVKLHWPFGPYEQHQGRENAKGVPCLTNPSNDD